MKNAFGFFEHLWCFVFPRLLYPRIKHPMGAARLTGLGGTWSQIILVRLPRAYRSAFVNPLRRFATGLSPALRHDCDPRAASTCARRSGYATLGFPPHIPLCSHEQRVLRDIRCARRLIERSNIRCHRAHWITGARGLKSYLQGRCKPTARLARLHCDFMERSDIRCHKAQWITGARGLKSYLRGR